MTDVLIIETEEHVRTLTMNRPDVRNAMNDELTGALTNALKDADADEDVHAVILTGSDPAFCAGLDLKAISAGEFDTTVVDDPDSSPWTTLRLMRTPVIGAVNGVAITGGLELVLGCSFLVASERAAFIDTHARVGIHPGGGLTGLLPEAIGMRKAREMSFTGNAVDAVEAHRLGLVNHLVEHEQLLPAARSLAADIADNDPEGVQRINDTYRLVAETTLAAGYDLEQERFREVVVDADEVARRREAVTERGRAQTT